MSCVAEITRDNNGSLSDSSFDVESEENFDRRRGQAQAGHSPSSGASRLANSPHQHRRNAAGRPRQPLGPPATSSYAARHDPGRRQHRSAVDPPDAAPSRRSTTAPGAGPVDYRGGRGYAAGHSGGKMSQDAGYGQQQSRLFVALFDYDPQTMSPNQNAIKDELPFTEGQIIKVYSAMNQKIENMTKHFHAETFC